MSTTRATCIDCVHEGATYPRLSEVSHVEDRVDHPGDVTVRPLCMAHALTRAFRAGMKPKT